MPGRATPARAAPLRLVVWTDDRDGWHARATWGRGQAREFDSPFELARFLVRLGEGRRPPRPGGLR
jgi:hypothetical protein